MEQVQLTEFNETDFIRDNGEQTGSPANGQDS